MPASPARRTRHPLVLRLALVLAGLAAAFLLAEITFRVVESIRLRRAGELWAVHDDVLGWLPNPRYGDHNALGLRDRPVAEKNGRTRILFLGDSVLYYGDDIDDTLVGHLRAELNDHRLGDTDARGFPRGPDPAPDRQPGAEPYDVVDAGVKGYTNWQELQFLKLRGLDLQPDLVGVAFVLNDCYRMLHQFRVEDGKIVGQSYDFSDEAVADESLAKRILRSSRLLVWLRHRFASIDAVPAGGYSFDHRPDFRAAWRDEPWSAIESQLREMADLGRARGFAVFLVVFPFGDQYRPEYLARDRAYVLKPQSRLAEICARLGIPCLDLYPLLDPRADLDEDKIHLSAPGRSRAAARIAAFLRTEKLLPAR